MKINRLSLVLLLSIPIFSLLACSSSESAAFTTASPTNIEMPFIEKTEILVEETVETPVPTQEPSDEQTQEIEKEEVIEANTPTTLPTHVGEAYLALPDASNWENWPELPVLSEEAIAIYRDGIAKGTDPHAISIFGDCQSLPDAFWGRYDDPDYVLSEDELQYQSSIDWFSGSFDRESVTVKKGTTAAAILWVGWLDGEKHDCEYGETPLACELRLHNPSIVIISVGTHWELRNGQYLRKILDELLAQGVLPVISTKADHREGEAWVNQEMVTIAQEYKLPVWNFWVAVQPLENNGMIEGDAMYMNDSGLDMQRISGLKVLDTMLTQLHGEE